MRRSRHAVAAAALLSLLVTVPSAALARQPDPRQMSGIPLQVPDLPTGTVTARVVRGALTNPVSGQSVQLTGAGVSQTAATDEAGRATFSGLAAGVRVKAVVVVDGERIESQEFEVPGTGGTRLMLVAGAAAAPAAASSPAASGGVVFGEQSRFVIESGDDALNVFYIVQIVNSSGRPVDGGGPIVFDLPSGAVGAGVLQDSAPNVVAAGSRVTVNGPFAPGNTVVQFAYSIPLGSERIVLAQRMPAALTRVTVIAQKLGAMQMQSAQIAQRREMNADGQTYIVGEGGALKAGDTLTLTLDGLPHRPTWPQNLALALAFAIIAAGVWGASRGGSPQVSARRQQMQARRDKLFAELAALEEQRRSGAVDARVYATRREQLVTALEDLYAGLERESAA
ncbi:MAG TPA: hypothetical protein VFK57_07400 [Vicinamibacterales bacterium]|nr:hypothetical protein [Vicinamibacterales bacterium]